MREFLDYDIKYPDLVIQLIRFFSHLNNGKQDRTIGDFVNSFQTPKGEDPLQPDIIGRICDRLCMMRKLICLEKKERMCLQDKYYGYPINEINYNANPELFLHHHNSFVYGFEYIYQHYRRRTIPVVVETVGGLTMGSSFRIYDGIATARHCLTDGKPVAIKGYTKEQLSGFKVFVSANPNYDLAFIKTGEKSIFNYGEPHVLDNVLVMGFPKVPCFLDFCTGEKGNISAMAGIRQTPTFGAIAAEGKMYFLPEQTLLLITAKVRGGNSGGPVINEEGYVVGIATGIPDGEGLSDDHMGYGIAYPIQALDIMLKENNELKVDFMDFPE